MNVPSDQVQRSAKIAQLNNKYRALFPNNLNILTAMIMVLSNDDRLALFEKVRSFNDFTQENDPFAEHDFGRFIYKEERYFWTIDYYDLKVESHSSDPSDPTITCRVLTLMHSSEY